MNQTDRPRNIRRTWRVDIYAGWGDGPSAVIKIGSHILCATADHEGRVTAEIDGVAQADPRGAFQMWKEANESGHLTLLEEEQLPPPPAPLQAAVPVIGKARACRLHRIMGMSGLPNAQHYALAAAALGEPWPLESLASLNEAEATTVWRHLCQLYPKAREVAARLSVPAAQVAA